MHREKSNLWDPEDDTAKKEGKPARIEGENTSIYNLNGDIDNIGNVGGNGNTTHMGKYDSTESQGDPQDETEKNRD